MPDGTRVVDAFFSRKFPDPAETPEGLRDPNTYPAASMNVTAGAKPEALPEFGMIRSVYSRRVLNIAGQVFCAALVTVFFAIRCVAKRVTRQPMGLEDVVYYGAGFHIEEINPQQYSACLKWLYIGSVVYCPAAYFAKATLLLLIARVFSVRRTVARGIHIFVLGILICYIPIQVAKMAVCVPIAAYWDSSVPGATCLDQNALFLCDLSLALVTDFSILLIPIPLTWSLRLSKWRRFKISLVLSLGGMATAVVCYRIYWILSTDHAKDLTYDFLIQDLFVKCWKSTKLSTLCTRSSASARHNQRRCIPGAGSSALMSTTTSDYPRGSSIHPMAEPALLSRAYHAGSSRAGSVSHDDLHHATAEVVRVESGSEHRPLVSMQATLSRANMQSMVIRRTTEIRVEVSHVSDANQAQPAEHSPEDV